MKLPIQLQPGAKMPVKGSPGAAGYDLFAMAQHLILPGRRSAIYTGVHVAIPSGHYGRVAPRSGLALKKGIDILGGVIDSDYRGEIIVIAYNSGAAPWEIQPGEKVAQLIIERCYDVDLCQFDELPTTERGSDGFGSTGK